MSDRGESYGGVSGNITVDGDGVGGEVCVSNSDSSVTGCVNGSTADEGTVGISLNIQW